MEEQWRPVPGWPYEASSIGRIKGPSGRILRSRPGSSGYLSLTVCRDGERREATIHRLVCSAFKGAPPAGRQCDHINGDPLDNRAVNLRWVTPRQNLATRRSMCGEGNPSAKLTAETVAWIRTAPASVTNAAIARAFDVTAEAIAQVRAGRTWGGNSLTIRRK